jgi:hypothetical protein
MEQPEKQVSDRGQRRWRQFPDPDYEHEDQDALGSKLGPCYPMLLSCYRSVEAAHLKAAEAAAVKAFDLNSEQRTWLLVQEP